jgi:hypothetical protein
MLNHCAQAAGMTAPLRYVVVEVSPRRRDVTIVQLGAAATSCVTAASGICPLPVIEPEQPVRLTIQSAAYEAPTRLVERSELDAGYLQLPIKVRGEMLLTIVASEATHPFLGWIAVESTFDDPEGELTSQDCFRDYRWEENECRSARADADGRVEFRYTKKLKDLKISLKDYRSAVAVWSGAPGSDRIDVAWPTSPNAKVDRDQPPAFPRQLPCGSRSSVESLLAHAAWPSTGEYSITMMIDAQGFISALDGAPDEVASHLKPRRIGVVANCKPTQWRLSYRARAE